MVVSCVGLAVWDTYYCSFNMGQLAAEIRTYVKHLRGESGHSVLQKKRMSDRYRESLILLGTLLIHSGQCLRVYLFIYLYIYIFIYRLHIDVYFYIYS